MEQFNLGVQLMAYGLTGVFTVLIVYFVMIKALVWLFPYKPEEKESEM
jgi:hypothetical protein